MVSIRTKHDCVYFSVVKTLHCFTFQGLIVGLQLFSNFFFFDRFFSKLGDKTVVLF